jgi:hypothetical protein
VSHSPVDPHDPARATLTLSPRAIVSGLACAAAVLVVISICLHLFTHYTGHDHLYGVVPLFDLDEEANVPSFFGAMLLLLAATLVALQAHTQYATGGRDRRRWALLALVVLAMAFDEAASAHELLTKPLRAALGAHGGFLHFTWVVPGVLVVIAFALAYQGFFRRLPSRVRGGVFIAGVLYLGGALGMEMVSARYAALHSIDTLFYKAVLVSIEEGMEMAGIIVLVRALLLQLSLSSPVLALRFAGSGRADPVRGEAASPGTTPPATTPIRPDPRVTGPAPGLVHAARTQASSSRFSTGAVPSPK